MGSTPGAGEALTALARGGVLEELRAGHDPVVWALGSDEHGLGERLATAVTGLRLVAIGDRGVEANDPVQPPAAPKLAIVGANAAGSALEPWVERAFELGCPYLYARRPADSRARDEPVDRWYWRYDVPVAGGERLTLGDVRRAAASDDRNRYRHTVGWRRLLPIAPAPDPHRRPRPSACP